MKVRWTTATAVIVAAIFLAVSSALADTAPPVTTTDSVTTTTQPVTTTLDPVDVPGTPATPPPAEQQIQPAPIAVPEPTIQLQTLLFKQAKQQIGLYYHAVTHWQKLMHLRLSPGGQALHVSNLISANKALAKLKQKSHRLHAAARAWMKRRTASLLAQAAHQRLVMGLRTSARTLAAHGNTEQQFIHARRFARATYQKYRNPPNLGAFMCIHRYEGSWPSNTGNSYYGGLQMNLGFQATYGGWLLRMKGTADHWTPLEQIWVAERALRSRGFWPWPNTARYCNLL